MNSDVKIGFVTEPPRNNKYLFDEVYHEKWGSYTLKKDLGVGSLSKTSIKNALQKVSMKNSLTKSSYINTSNMDSFVEKKGKMFDQIDVIRDNECKTFSNCILQN